MKKVLIAHQSTIPHYRIPFYNALEQLKSPDWRFDVVFDADTRKNYFKEDFDVSEIRFPVLNVKTYSVKYQSKIISYQSLFNSASKYDVLVLENTLNNLAYPLCHAHRIFGKKIIYWGIGKQWSVRVPSLTKRIVEFIKINLVRRSDGYFAYTDGVKSYVVSKGIPPEKVFILNNTIDILQQRSVFNKYKHKRNEYREQLGVKEKKVLLFVGRFNKNKRIEFLLDTFSHLKNKDHDFHLLMVGGGGGKYLSAKPDGITYFGPITDPEKLAPIYIASDVFSFPGLVGLGPLQALCYDLPTITIDTPTQSPEYEYMNESNSIRLPENTSSLIFANTLEKLFANHLVLEELRSNAWESIKHLTIEKMAQNFIHGIDNILNSTS